VSSGVVPHATHRRSGAADVSTAPVRGFQLVVTDVEAARVELIGRGVDLGPVCQFVDGGWRDGNGWAIQQTPTTG